MNDTIPFDDTCPNCKGKMAHGNKYCCKKCAEEME